MTGGPFRPQRRLTVGERGRLAQCVILIAAAATDTERRHAIAVAVAAARSYRHDGVTWREIAAALGISADVLRDWRSEVRRPSTSQEDTRSSPVALGHQSAAARAGSVILVATGDASVGGNDFANEVACVRKALRGQATVIERANIEIGELRREIDEHWPITVHLAAHADFSAIHLSLDGAPMAVLPDDIARAIRSAAHPPSLVVLNCCDSDQLARTMVMRRDGRSVTGVERAIGWRGAVTDEQARVFASLFYGGYDGWRRSRTPSATRASP